MASRSFLGRLLSTSAALLAPTLAPAQAVRDTLGPRAGSWAAELGVGSGQSATLLRFRSPTSAVMIGAEVFWLGISEDVPELGGTREERYSLANVTARVGVRRYRATTTGIRPFTSLGLLAGYTRDRGGPGWTAGAFGELGASYLFSPHVSLGAVGGLQAFYTRFSQRFGTDQSLARRQVTIRASAVQVLGAVYF
jgi:hypothetical protein